MTKHPFHRLAWCDRVTRNARPPAAIWSAQHCWAAPADYRLLNG